LQATLLGAAIAIILALVAALVGPLFVDWTQYRGVFEAHATRIVGQPVRVTGAIDVRILPSPSLVLRGVEIGEVKEPRVKARELGIEFGLGPLFRGELRAVDMRVVGPDLRLGLDAEGRLDWPTTQAGLDPDQLSIDRLRLADGRVVVTDARSGGGVVLEKLSFNGELRSLLGPVKGEGGFNAEGERYSYRVSAGRPEGDGAKIKLALDPSARPFTIEADGTLRFESAGPAFDGTLAVSRPAGVAPASGRGVAAVPWRASGRVKATSASALFEQLDVQYGPEGRAIKLSGVAQMKLGKSARVSGVLSAREVDLDQVFDLPEGVRNSPIAAARMMAETIAGLVKVPFPLQLGVGIDSMTLAGSPIQAVRGDLKFDTSGFDIESFEFRAPGATQVRVSGHLALAGAEATFRGPASIDAADPRAFAAWLEGRDGASREPVGPMRASGEVAFGNDRIAIERFKAEIDRKTVEGRLVYAAALAGRPARVETELKAAVLDIDRLVAVGRAALAGTSFDLPGETVLAIDIGRATVAGLEAKDAAVKLRLDAGGLVLERVAVSDFGGTTFNLSGRIESPFAGPHGAVTLDADARSLDGALALLARFAPEVAENMRSVAARLVPLKTHATLALAADRGAAGPSKFMIEGTAGPVRLRLGAQANGDASAPAALDTRFEGELAADDGRALVALLGFDRAVAVDKQAGRLSFSGQGVLYGDLQVDAKLAAGGLAASANGVVRVFGAEPATATLATTLSANMRLPRPGDGETRLPLALTTRVTAKPGTLTLDELAGTLAGVPVRGRLEAGLGTPIRIEGQLDADTLNVPVLLASAIGATIKDEPTFSPEPFASGSLDRVRGHVRLSAARVAVTPGLVAPQARANVRLSDGEVALEDIEGELAAGRLSGAVTFRRVGDGVAMHGRLALADADAAALLPGEGRPGVAGKLTMHVEADATGRSPAALIGSLAGTGTVSLAGADIAGFDPDAFNAVIRAVDEEATIDAAKVRDIMAAALERGRLRVERADAAFTIAAGDARLSTAILHGEAADLSVTGHFNLADRQLDARLTFSASAPTGSSGGRPEVYVTVRGPLGATQRAVDATTLSAWLTLRAVDREARRIDALEASRAPTLVPTETPPASTGTAPAPPPDAPAPASTTPPPTARPVAPPPRRPPPASRPEASATPGPAAPALPPPINIRPPASSTGTPPRPKAPGAAAAPAKPAPARTPPEAPAEERSLLERLFGSQR
jgi:uncharacterized protein involved in outer membrane biogenesis